MTILVVVCHSICHLLCDGMLQQMTQTYIQKQAGYRLHFGSVLMQLLYELIMHYAVELTPTDLTEDACLKAVLVYIHKQYQTKISLREVAERFHYNPDYLSRIFKRRVDVTFIRSVWTRFIKMFWGPISRLRRFLRDTVPITLN